MIWFLLYKTMDLYWHHMTLVGSTLCSQELSRHVFTHLCGLGQASLPNGLDALHLQAFIGGTQPFLLVARLGSDECPRGGYT
jgi:hypothetical protein